MNRSTRSPRSPSSRADLSLGRGDQVLDPVDLVGVVASACAASRCRAGRATQGGGAIPAAATHRVGRPARPRHASARPTSPSASRTMSRRLLTQHAGTVLGSRWCRRTSGLLAGRLASSRRDARRRGATNVRLRRLWRHRVVTDTISTPRPTETRCAPDLRRPPARRVRAGRRGRDAGGDPRRPDLGGRGPAVAADLPADRRAARRGGPSGSRSTTPSWPTRSASGRWRVILAEGGLTTDWREMRPASGSGSRWRPLGVAVSVAVVAVGAHYLLGLPWELAILLGAICSPTDAAAVFSVLRVVPLPKRLTGALEAESGLNDAPTVVLVGIISTGAARRSRASPRWPASIAFELLAGGLIGRGGRASPAPGSCAGPRCPSSGLYPLAVLCLAFTAYGAAAALHASGFAAIYVAALILGNSELPHRVATRSFAEGVAWLAQIGLFVMLGLLLSPGRIDAATPSSRRSSPASCSRSSPGRCRCWPAASSSRWRWRDLAFISWAGLRGAVPIVLATIPLAEGVDGRRRPLRHRLRDGRRLHPAHRPDPAAGWPGGCGVARRSEPRGLDVEAAPLDRVAADLLQVTIAPTLEDARRRGRGAAAAPGGLGLAGDPRADGAGARASYGPAHGRRPPRRHPAQAARGHRGRGCARCRRTAGSPSGSATRSRHRQRT